jgi:hypothetical protein
MIFDADKIINLLKSLGYYIILFGIAAILHHSSPGGPCVPSGGMLFILFALPVSAVILVIRNGYLLYKGKKEHILSLLFHIVLILVCLISAVISSF